MDILKNHNFSDIDVTVVADSAANSHRVTSIIATFPRYILAEVNTHRMLSRNSASSRAIPFVKMLRMVKDNPYIPKRWQKDHPGMQGTEYFTPSEIELEGLIKRHLEGRDLMIDLATSQNAHGVTKQVCNRYLEPFAWQTALVTATDWENLLAQRAEEGADIHFQELAYKILEKLNTSEPKRLQPGEWHIPFGDHFDEERLLNLTEGYEDFTNAMDYYKSCQIKIAVARCARLSYMNFDGKDDYSADIKLHDRLYSMAHFSPFEHIARAMTVAEYQNNTLNVWPGEGTNVKVIKGVSGNLRGFIQYRKMLTNENRTDSRLIPKGLF